MSMALRTWARIAVFVAVVFLQGRSGVCQTKGGGGTAGNSGTSGAGSNGTTTTTTTLPTSTTNNTAPATSTMPVFISGRVLMEDGTPPPEPAAIERVCTSITRTEGYTDSGGYFAIQLGNEQGVFQDASEDNSRSLRSITGGGGTGGGSPASSNASLAGGRFSGCDIRARLAGYRSQSISLATHRAMDNPDIGVILLHRQAPEEGTTVSMVSLAAPKDARKAFEKGLAAARKNNAAEAEVDFQKSIALYPKYAAAWTELGKIQAARNDLVNARQSFDQAIQADPKFLDPFMEIGLLAMQARKWQELAEVTDRAMRLDPFEFPQFYLFNAVANYNLKNLDAAERSIQAAAKLDTLQRFAEISYLQGLILIQRHDYPAAAERLRNYLKLAPDGSEAPVARNQLNQLDKLIAQNATTPPGPNPDR
jgi:tetratricopeptide (TPR) repeat protein